jgi:aspartyl-tRNA(Asn)/glutamyl-tRNA(Gln) amidotransferase subunit A
MRDEELAFWSIGQLGAAYRAGRLSPVEVTRLCLERIEGADGKLNAFITVLEQPALRAARTAERELKAGRDRGPLHGVPIAIKDLVDVAGAPTGYGSDPAFREQPQTDAELVRRLRGAGAVILGKTNLLEFAYGAVNPKVGQTNNPWDLTRTSGGSSGGSAASVAAGLCYAAIGTDTGGSIRGPAAYCGIAGLKPSYDIVPLHGVFPLSWSLDHGGPLARSCRDAGALLEAMTGQDFPVRSRRLNRMRLGLVTQHVDASCIRNDVRQVFEQTCQCLENAGARLVRLDIPEFHLCIDALMMVLLPEASVIHAERYAKHPAGYGWQTRMQIEQGFLVPGVSYVRAQQFRRHLAARLTNVLRDVDAIISPTVPWIAPDADPAINQDEGFDEMLFVAPYNLAGLPALSVPCGLGDHDLPVGLQIAGAPHGDAVVLSIGASLEGLIRINIPRSRSQLVPKAPPAACSSASVSR